MDIVESGVTGDLYDVPGAGSAAHVEALSGTMKRSTTTISTVS